MIHPEYSQWCGEYEHQLQAQGGQDGVLDELTKLCHEISDEQTTEVTSAISPSAAAPSGNAPINQLNLTHGDQTMTQHIQPVTNPEGKAAELLNAVKQALGATPNMFTTFANAPAAFEGYLSLNGALQGGALDPKFKEKLALTVAGLNGCDYCASAHTFLGSKAGISDEELANNLHGKSSNPTCQAGLDFATKIVQNRGHVRESDINAVRDAGFSDERIIEIVAHVALNTLTNYFNEVFKVEIDFPKVSSAATQKAA